MEVTMKSNKKELFKELENLYYEIDSNDDIDFMTPPFYDCYPQTIKELKEEIKYCNDILIQLLAINKSIKSVSNEILRDHLATCVVRDIKNDDPNVMDEVMELIRRLN